MSKIIIDLDHTLLDTTSFKEALAKSLGLTPVDWDMAYNKFLADYQMFNPTDFLKGVATAQKKQFEAVVKKTGSFLYPDSVPFLKKAIQAGHHVVVLTFGNQDWQTQKLQHIAWPDGVTLLTTDTTKSSQLAQYMEDDTLVVDDNGRELDALHRHWSTAKLYWMVRPNGKYRDVEPVSAHSTIHSLNQIKL